MSEPTNLDAITTWCHACGRPVSMPHEHGDAPLKPTPTVIESDRALAARWFRSSPGDISAASALEAKMASEIAAAREAWGREAVAGLVDKWEGEAATYPEHGALAAAAVRLCAKELRAALERVKEGGSARE